MRGAAVSALILTIAAVLTQGDYSQIANLDYGTDMPNHGCMASTLCSVMQMQSYLRTGVDPGRLSPAFLMIEAGTIPGDDVIVLHGFSSPILGWQLAHDWGSCPVELCPKSTLTVRGMTAYNPDGRDDAREAALPFRVGNFTGYADLPNCQTAYSWLATRPGAAVIVGTDGYPCYAIMGLDSHGRGIWLTHYGISGPAQIDYLDAVAGQQRWDAMTLNSCCFGPENYVAGIEMK